MDRFKKIFGDSPPCPLEDFEKTLNIYSSSNTVIFLPKTSVNLPEGHHSHKCYEFFVPISRPLVSLLEKSNLAIKKNHVLPINPGQEHGTTTPVAEVYCLGLHIDKDFLQGMSRQVYGKSDVVFLYDGCSFSSLLGNLTLLFMEEYENRQAGSEFILQSLETQIAINLLRILQSNLPSPQTFPNYREKDNIKRAIEFLREHYNNNYTLNDIAKVANFSPYHFIRVFKAQTGKTPHEFFVDLKIEKAKEMLASTRKTVTEICFACGFNNINHFTTVFKRKVGVTPTCFRKEMSY